MGKGSNSKATINVNQRKILDLLERQEQGEPVNKPAGKEPVLIKKKKSK